MHDLKTSIVLDGHSLNLEDATAIAHGAPLSLCPKAEQRVRIARDHVESILEKEKPVYGINTGFGYFAQQRIDHGALQELQVNLIRSHASGYGPPLSQEETRLAMALRLNVLLKGYSGARFEVCRALHQLLIHGIYPLVPEQGSVGASGDLAPLAHLALPLIGEGRVSFQGRILPASDALTHCNLQPLLLEEKEGLTLVNGTQVMGSVGGLALARGCLLIEKAHRIAALSFEGMHALTDALHPSLHHVREQQGQIHCAQQVRNALEGSYLYTTAPEPFKVQDPYSLRCTPQVHGASHDALHYARSILEREFNAATDNPLVFSEEGKIVSGGNFHGQPLAMAFDIAALALAELGNISERRLELLLNPHFSHLNAFLAAKAGLNSGYMAAQYLSASLVNENKLLANPACTDSIPGNVGVEDHVSMGMTSARKLRKIADHLTTILSVEFLAAAQAIDMRGARPLGKGTSEIYHLLREKVPPLNEDRIVADDVEQARRILEEL